ncbi:MAG: outer membrane lipoprotein-sorting protein [Myxococcales bacterium]|nr:outer membrane lipoprotein-sorting protein [Myxococcales bacterium]
MTPNFLGNRRPTLLAALLTVALLSPMTTWAADAPLPTVKTVVQKLDDLYRSKTSKATMTMKVVKRRRTRALTMEMWTRGQDQALIVIRKPAREAGTATLKNKDELYNYAPRADRLIRIPSGLLGSSWMGSHFSNDDLVRETSWDRDYATKLSWQTDGGKRALLATMTPKPGAPVVYTKVLFFMDAKHFTPVRTEFYDRKKLIRTMRYEDVRVVAGRRIPHRMILQPAKKPKERTEMIYEQLQLDVPVPASTFTKRGLRRAAKR